MKNFVRVLGAGIGYPFCVFDSSEHLVACNREFEKVLGVSDLVGATLHDILEVNEFSPLVPEIRASFGGKKINPFVVSIAGFPVRHYQAIVKFIETEAETNYVVLTLADVTDKIESLDIVKSTRDFYSEIFDDMPQAYMIVDESLNVIRANKAAPALFGREAMAILGLNLMDFFEIKSDGAHADPLAKLISGEVNSLHLGEFEDVSGLRTNGTRFPVRLLIIRSNILDLRTYSVIVVDLTHDRVREMRRLDEEKQLQGKLRNEALGKLAGKFAHDMNNVLAVISGYTEMLTQAVHGEDIFMLNQVRDAVKRGSGLTANILAYTSGRQIETRVVNLRSFLLAEEAVWRQCLGDGISLKLDIPESGITAIADEKFLQQAILNLLTNSKEALENTGQVVLGLRKTVLNDAYMQSHGVRHSGGTFAEIYVSDAGPGVSPEVAQLMFQPYYTTKDPQRSSGLGLAIVLGIVKQHDGFIFRESNVWGGAELRIFIPESSAEEDLTQKEEIIPEINHRDHQILIVDDEPQVLDILQRYLTQAGFRVIQSQSAQRAIELVEEHEAAISLLISDIMMPQVTGVELAQKVLEICPLMPIIFITGYSHQIIDKHPTLRNFRLLNKPFSPDEIVRTATHEIAKTVRDNDTADYSQPE